MPLEIFVPMTTNTNELSGMFTLGKSARGFQFASDRLEQTSSKEMMQGNKKILSQHT